MTATITWLRPNRRVLIAAMIPVALVVVCATIIVVSGAASEGRRIGGLVAVGGGLIGLAFLTRRCLQPRLAYANRRLLVYLGTAQPLEVPIGIVECFFLGHADTKLPAYPDRTAKVSGVVVRLAESATDWKQRSVKPSLGNWEDGYIVVRGTWCEPIDGDLVNALNDRLRTAQRELHAQPCESRRG